MNDFHQGPSAALMSTEAVWGAGGDIVRGKIVRWDRDGLFVECELGDRGEQRAELGVAMSAGVIRDAIATKRTVFLAVGRGGADALVVVIGLRHELPALDPATGAPLETSSVTDARVDGRRVTLEGKDEIVLRCGSASLILRRNGYVVMRGVRVETRAKGVNRIKGGSVQIN